MDGFIFQTPAGENSVSDISFTAGVGLRAMRRSIEIELGYCNERHNNGWVDGTGSLAIVSTGVFWGELSHIDLPHRAASPSSSSPTSR